jgi:hypothetical protein
MPAPAAQPEGQNAATAALLENLKARVEGGSDPCLAVLETIAQWPLGEETIGGTRIVYLIAGEAFDWRLLADRLIRSASVSVETVARLDTWLESPDPYGGLEEAEFTRILGVEKSRAFLNYFYGVIVERALLSAVQEEITKGRVANGREPTDRAREEAYARLYGEEHDELWQEFRTTHTPEPPAQARSTKSDRSISGDDVFTYWLFRRRVDNSDPARIASDTRKGLVYLERMRQAQVRRQELLAQKPADRKSRSKIIER